jgi:hypothetical protein
VTQSNAVFGELSVLLDQSHMADVRALETSQISLCGRGSSDRASPVVFTNYNSLGTSAGSVGTPPDVNAARNGNVVMLSYNTSVLLSIDGTVSYNLLDRFGRRILGRP